MGRRASREHSMKIEKARQKKGFIAEDEEEPARAPSVESGAKMPAKLREKLSRHESFQKLQKRNQFRSISPDEQPDDQTKNYQKSGLLLRRSSMVSEGNLSLSFVLSSLIMVSLFFPPPGTALLAASSVLPAAVWLWPELPEEDDLGLMLAGSELMPESPISDPFPFGDSRHLESGSSSPGARCSKCLESPKGKGSEM